MPLPGYVAVALARTLSHEGVHGRTPPPPPDARARLVLAALGVLAPAPLAHVTPRGVLIGGPT